ncbi:4-hydroxyphenylacetate 3-hydroxylase family protein [Burkholderia singularis]|uniref:4-hydroxyphenylacetate 3-monooxygenase n=1 Tax=Burkholderia singularis TaxID=1503053 RepID=A0A238H263_9BURK|nr:4-hydroxyphenylacetate 3-hydroxylase family protein [Burkholderia singularis]SMF99285.1 4-hydroxyphenylacetate 3-monooxygenase [Burkholderia singularis]
MTLMNGDDYLESLRDGRNVYLGGERIKDVTTHRAFRNAARSIASLYDALHGEHRERLTAPDQHGQITHRFFKPSYSADDLLSAQDAIRIWSQMTYGFMGRTPDYKAAFMSGLEAGADYYGDFRQNAVAWYKRFASHGLYLNHAIINPPLDRGKTIHDMRDVFVHVVSENDRGIVVSGVKMLATAGALTNATFVAPVASALLEPGKAEDFAVVFFARMDNPGLSLMCRPSYEAAATSPFDAPLASRFDENDSVLIFDNALIPWEDVLVYRDVKRATGFYSSSGFANLYNFQSGIRLAVKLELMIGLLSFGTRANGTHAFRGIQAALGELIALWHLLRAVTSAMARDPERTAAGVVVPRLEYASALRIQVPQIWKRVRELMETALGGSPLVTVSSAADLLDPHVEQLIGAYYRGAALEPEQRIKLFKLIWDATGSEFGSRHSVYETHYSGNFDQIRLDSLTWATRSGQLASCEEFARHCMDDYDTAGWLRGPWVRD